MGLLDAPGMSRQQADTRYPRLATRTRGYVNSRILVRQMMTTPPALTIVSGVSTVVGGSGSSTPNNLITNGLVTIAGAAGIIPSTIGNTAMYRRSDRAPDVNNRKDGPIKLIFGTDAAMFAINVYWDSGSTYRLQVDDQYVSLTPASPGVAGSTRWLLVDFTSAGGAKPRKIVFETQAAVQGIDIPVTASLWPIKPKGPTVVYFGDSYTGGSAGNDASFTTWPSIVADALGWENTFQNAVGSTGIEVTVSGFANNAPAQVAAYTGVGPTPDIVIATWGHNDVDTDANLAASLKTVFQTMRTQWPNAILIYGSSFFTGGALTSTWVSREAAGLAAVQGIADYTIAQASGVGRPFFTGSGRVGATTGTGNSDTYVYTDGIHPTQAGHNYLGLRMAHELAAILA